MMPTADEIFDRKVARASWPSSRLALALVVEMLPTIEDYPIADLVEHLALAIVDRDDELSAMRAVTSAALALAHTQHLEIGRLQKRLIALLDDLRVLRAKSNGKHKDRTEEALREDKKREGEGNNNHNGKARTSTGPMHRSGLEK